MYTFAKYDNLDVPTWALPYLVNGDGSGLNEDEIKQVDAWFNKFVGIAKKQKNADGAHALFLVDDDDVYFTHYPEFGLACNCTKCTVLIVGDDTSKIGRLYTDNDGNLPSYSWFGGYRIFYVDANNSVLCPNCANIAYRDTDEYPENKPCDYDINYEDDSLYCASCHKKIESSYGGK